MNEELFDDSVFDTDPKLKHIYDVIMGAAEAFHEVASLAKVVGMQPELAEVMELSALAEYQENLPEEDRIIMDVVAVAQYISEKNGVGKPEPEAEEMSETAKSILNL